MSLRSFLVRLSERIFRPRKRQKDGDNETSVRFVTDVDIHEATSQDEEPVETLYEESRTVLDHQISLLNDIDDKAARTVRITVLFIGAILGAASFGGESGISFTTMYPTWGVAYLITSIAFGMKTYNVSDPVLGPSRSDLTLLSSLDGDRTRRRYLINNGFTGWIDENATLNRINGWYLDLTQWSLLCGLISLSVGFWRQLSSTVESGKPGVLGRTATLLIETTVLGIPLVGLPLLFFLFLAVVTALYSVYRQT